MFRHGIYANGFFFVTIGLGEGSEINMTSHEGLHTFTEFQDYARIPF